jgi:uncharacterized protein
MKEEIRALVNYRLERAKESIEEAKILVERGHVNTFINRLYYACFYAVSALLLTKGLSSPKHSGVRSLFHQNFVKSGIMGIESGQFFDKLFDNRQKADYSDLLRINVNEVYHWYDETKEFVAKIENILQI